MTKFNQSAYLTSGIPAIFLLFMFFGFSHLGFGQQYFPVKINQKWGLIDEKGELFVEPVYDAVDRFIGDYARVQSGKKIGLINKQGRQVFKCEFEEIISIGSGFFDLQQNGAWSVYDESGSLILSEAHEELELLPGNFLAFKQSGLWGLVSSNGRILLQPDYISLNQYKDGFFLIRKQAGIGIADSTGKVILEAKFEAVAMHEPGLFFSKHNNLWQLSDYAGNFILNNEWKDYHIIDRNFIRMKDSSGYSLFSTNHFEVLARGKYDDFLPFSENLCRIKKEGLFGLLNDRGQVILDPLFEVIEGYDENLFKVRMNGLWGLFAGGGNIILPPEYDDIGPPDAAVALVRQGELSGIANLRGEVLTEIKYESIGLEDNYAQAIHGGALQILVFDENGNLQGTDEFENFGTLRIGNKTRRAPQGVITRSSLQDKPMEKFQWFFHKKSGKWGLKIRENGKIVIPPTYDHVIVKAELGFTLVALEQVSDQSFDRTFFDFRFVYGIIDNKSGLPVTQVNLWDIRLEDLEVKKLPVARCIFQGGRHGLINKKGVVILEDFIYIGDFQDGKARMSPKGMLTANLKPDREDLEPLKSYLNNILTVNVRASVTRYDIEVEDEAALQCKDCTWGFLDTLGLISIPPRFDYAENFVNGVSIIRKGEKWGTIGLEGEVLLETEFDEISFVPDSDNSILRIYLNEIKCGLIDSNGSVIVPASYEEIGRISENRVAVKKANRWGFCDENGTEIIPCQYEKAGDFSEGIAAVRMGRKWGFIDPSGNLIIDYQYRRCGKFSGGLAWVTPVSKSGYINKEGHLVIPDIYTECFDFKNDIARIRNSGGYGLIDVNGEVILRPKHQTLSTFNPEGTAIAYDGNGYFFVNQNGDKINNQKFRKINEFSDGRYIVWDNGKYGIADAGGNQILEPTYQKIENFSEGFAGFMEAGAWGYLDYDGQVVIQPQYSRLLDFQDSLAVVYFGMRNSGLIDSKGNFLIEPVINRITAYSEGLVLIRDVHFRYYFASAKNKFHAGYFEDARPFSKGLAAVKVNGMWGFINQKGIEVVPPKYHKIDPEDNGYSIVNIHRFSGIASLSGEVILEPKYEYISFAGSNLLRIEQDDRLGYLNLSGEWVWPVEP